MQGQGQGQGQAQGQGQGQQETTFTRAFTATTRVTTPQDVILSKVSPNGRRFLIGGANGVRTRLRFTAEPMAETQHGGDGDASRTLVVSSPKPAQRPQQPARAAGRGCIDMDYSNAARDGVGDAYGNKRSLNETQTFYHLSSIPKTNSVTFVAPAKARPFPLPQPRQQKAIPRRIGTKRNTIPLLPVPSLNR